MAKRYLLSACFFLACLALAACGSAAKPHRTHLRVGGGDVGDTVRVAVSTCNGFGGCATATSAQTAVVTGGGPAVNYYVSQSGGSPQNGTSCADAEPVSWFNNASNWGSSHSIVPGTTIGLCGTISTALTLQGSGTAGNPITIYWEPGATLSAPTWSTSPNSSAISMANLSYITLNGGNNGTSIQATQEGTGLTYQGVADKGIWAGAANDSQTCNNCTVENLTIANLYVNKPPVNFTGNVTNGSNVITNVSSTAGFYVGLALNDGTGGAIPSVGGNTTTITGITSGSCPSGCSVTMSQNATASVTADALQASDATFPENPDHTSDNAIVWNGSNDVIADNTIHDVGWALYSVWGTGTSNQQIYGNNIYNADHSMALTGGSSTITGVYVYDNHMHDWASWDSNVSQLNGYPNHHDGIHCYGPGPNGTPYNGFYIYNNRFDGTFGGTMSSPTFMEGNFTSGGTPCAAIGSSVWIFNNISLPTDNMDCCGLLGDSAGGGGEFNNMVRGPENNQAIGSCMGFGASANGATDFFENNIMDDCNILISGAVATSGATSGTYAAGSLDYDAYVNGGSNSFGSTGPSGANCSFLPFSSYSTWKSCMGGIESHGLALATDTAAGLNTDGSLAVGSVLSGAGNNLTSTCNTFPTSPVNVQAACETTYAGPPAGGGAASTTAGTSRPSTGGWNIGAT